MKNFLIKVKLYVLAHKIISVIVLIAILLFGYWGYGKLTNTSGETRYVTSKVTTGTIVASVTGSGQVAASNQLDIKPTVSGTITYVGVQPGDKVKSGQLLFEIDSTNAEKAVRDAEASLQSAQIALQKLNIQNSNANMDANTAKAYDDGFSAVSDTFLDLPNIMSGLNDMFFKSTTNSNGQINVDWFEAQVASSDTDNVKSYKQAFLDSYNAATAAYNENYNDYKSASRTSDNSTIEALVSQSYNTTKLVSDTIKNANSYFDFINNSIEQSNTRTSPPIIATDKNALSGYASEVNSHLSNLLSAETEIQSNKDSLQNSSLDSQSQQLSITQQQNALEDAKNNLADYYIHAPFDGIMASVPAQKGDDASSGTALGTIITSQRIATIPLNEVDIAKIMLGQKATLTFDALPDLTLTGKVSEIDSIGTVSQGVVDYNVKITFDTNDNRVKPGMSVNAAIITSVAQNVLTVSSGAIKTQGGTSYVEVFDTPLPAPATGVQGSPSPTPPREQIVTTGISDDTSTEILSGLNEGDQVVTKTITGSTSATSSAPSIFSAVGGNRTGASGGTRVFRAD